MDRIVDVPLMIDIDQPQRIGGPGSELRAIGQRAQ
jgi:hypothetical protein